MGDSLEAIAFDDYRLLPSQRLLLDNGAPVAIGSRAFDILRILVERRPQVVSKDELIRAVWGGQAIEDNTLAVHLSALRKALGDAGREGRYIRTLIGKGYLFAAPVQARHERVEAAEAPGYLPHAEGPLIGRADSLATVAALLDKAALVTLTGPGGIGKTRLAIAAGEAAAPRFPDGVWWVDLTAIGDPSLVPATVASALSLKLGDAPPLPRLVTGLKGSHRLLILDNCEHVITGAAELAVALRGIDGIRLLATSLEPLEVTGEQVVRLGPLGVPTASAGVEDAAEAPSVQLFVARAKVAAGDFHLDRDNVAAVVRICHQLDGVPLALELAAVRAALLGADAVARRLGERLLELSSNRRDRLPKHQTLRALLGWSYSLLAPAEQTVLRRLAVFAGGCTLEAAEAVVTDAAVPEWRIAEHMASLIAKSLLVVERMAQGERYRLLETTRIYAAEQLAEAQEAAAAAERHARYFAALFDRAYALWEETPDDDWLRSHAPELDNLRAALRWAFADTGRGDLAVRLAGGSALLWKQLALTEEGRGNLLTAAARIGENTPRHDAARLLMLTGYFHVNLDRMATQPFAEQAVALYRQLDDPAGLSAALSLLSGVYNNLDRPDEAEAAVHEAHALAVAGDCKKQLGSTLNHLGLNAFVARRDIAAARSYLERAVALAHEMRRPSEEAHMLINLADVVFAAGEAARAAELAQSGMRLARQFGRWDHVAVALANLTCYFVALDNLAEARRSGREALVLLQEAGGGLYLRICLELWSLIGALEGRYVPAALLRGHVMARFASSGEIREPVDQDIYDRLSRTLEAAVPQATLEACYAEGGQWDEPTAVSFAFAQLVDPAGGLGPPDFSRLPLR